MQDKIKYICLIKNKENIIDLSKVMEFIKKHTKYKSVITNGNAIISCKNQDTNERVALYFSEKISNKETKEKFKVLNIFTEDYSIVGFTSWNNDIMEQFVKKFNGIILKDLYS